MSDTRLVYSTDGHQARDLREEAPAERRGRPGRSAKQTLSVPEDGVVRIFRERGGRSGRMVTVVRGLPVRGPALETIAGDLKRLCGAGGAVKDRVVEVQGDHRERIAERLRVLGYTVKLAGG